MSEKLAMVMMKELAEYGDPLANELLNKLKSGKIKSAKTALSVYQADEKWRNKKK